MNAETANAIGAIIAATLFSLGTLLLSKRAGEKRSLGPKAASSEYAKNYADDFILQLQSRIEECAKRAESAEGLAKAAKEQVDLLNMRTTDLENQIIDLKGQIAVKKQDITRIEGERDTAIAERNTLRDQPERSGATVEAFVDLLMAGIEKRLPLTIVSAAPATADAGDTDTEELPKAS